MGSSSWPPCIRASLWNFDYKSFNIYIITNHVFFTTVPFPCHQSRWWSTMLISGLITPLQKANVAFQVSLNHGLYISCPCTSFRKNSLLKEIWTPSQMPANLPTQKWLSNKPNHFLNCTVLMHANSFMSHIIFIWLPKCFSLHTRDVESWLWVGIVPGIQTKSLYAKYIVLPTCNKIVYTMLSCIVINITKTNLCII